MNSYTSGQGGTQGQPCYGCGDNDSGQNLANAYQSALPTGIPTGPLYAGPIAGLTQAQNQMSQTGQTGQIFQPSQNLPRPTGMTPADMTPITALNQPLPVTTQNIQYINTFLRTQIGKKVTVDFLIGTGTLVDKTGTLLGVGANYILINEVETDDLLVCDFYSIKFVRVYY